MRKEKVLALVISLLCLFQYSAASACPDLSGFYEMSNDEIYSIEAELSALSSECSDSSEYFALLGSVQLKVGDLLQANESLELALLLNPQNGSALFDYAEILNQQGQLLNAIELAEQLLQREVEGFPEEKWLGLCNHLCWLGNYRRRCVPNYLRSAR